MSEQEKPPAFAIALGDLKSRNKDDSPAALRKADQAGAQHGFVPRGTERRGGRQPSPRTGQIHAKVLPNVAEDIAAEAVLRGVTQGILIEEAWTLYRARHK
jgi:hypothetical protein